MRDFIKNNWLIAVLLLYITVVQFQLRPFIGQVGKKTVVGISVVSGSRNIIPIPNPHPSNTIWMNQREYDLCIAAIALVCKDVENGAFSNSADTIDALAAHLPSTVKKQVIAALGTPSIGAMREQLAILAGKLDVEK
jgi:hypothetical protein